MRKGWRKYRRPGWRTSSRQRRVPEMDWERETPVAARSVVRKAVRENPVAARRVARRVVRENPVSWRSFDRGDDVDDGDDRPSSEGAEL